MLTFVDRVISSKIASFVLVISQSRRRKEITMTTKPNIACCQGFSAYYSFFTKNNVLYPFFNFSLSFVGILVDRVLSFLILYFLKISPENPCCHFLEFRGTLVLMVVGCCAQKHKVQIIVRYANMDVQVLDIIDKK